MTKPEADRAPVRVQLSRKKGWRMPENTVSVARPGTWGNPFKIGQHVRSPSGLPMELTTAAQVVALFRANALDPEAGFVFRRNVAQALRGKNLACWCPLDQPCHADTLLEIANG